MKLFHISDVLSVTTWHVVSRRQIEGFFEILKFLTGDRLSLLQLPRALRECEPWLRSQFPNLMKDSAGMPERLADLEYKIETAQQEREQLADVVAGWVEQLRNDLRLPEQLAVYELGEDMHTRIDPVEEARAMVGDDKVISSPKIGVYND